MDPRYQRANGFVLPGEDPDDLVATAQSALATVPKMSAMVADLQQQNQHLQQMVQQSQQMITAMMLQAKDTQAQLTTGRLVPVLPQLAAHAGLLANIPSYAMTGLTMSREINPEGGVSERLALSFDPPSTIRAMGERTRDEARGVAAINHSKSVMSKLLGRGDD